MHVEVGDRVPVEFEFILIGESKFDRASRIA